MTTAWQVILVHLTFEKRRTAAFDLTEFLRFCARKHTRLQLFWVTIKLSVDIGFQKLRPFLYFFCPPLMAAAGYRPAFRMNQAMGFSAVQIWTHTSFVNDVIIVAVAGVLAITVNFEIWKYATRFNRSKLGAYAIERVGAGAPSLAPWLFFRFLGFLKLRKYSQDVKYFLNYSSKIQFNR